MTVAQFEAIGGTTDTQALRCFLRLKDFLDSRDETVESTRRMTVEVSRHESLEAVMRARTKVFGRRRPRFVSNRLTRLPPGQQVRLSIELDDPDNQLASTPTARDVQS